MEIWKIVLISLLAAIALGAIGGVVVGKYLVKREKHGKRRLLSTKERIIYAACLVLGAAFILFGVFFNFNGGNNPDMVPEGAITDNESGVMGGGEVVGLG